MSDSSRTKRPVTNGRVQPTAPSGKVAGTARTSSTPSRPITKTGSTPRTTGGSTKLPTAGTKVPSTGAASAKVPSASAAKTTSTGATVAGPKTTAARQATAISNQERKRRARRQAEMQQRLPLFLTVGGVAAIILVFVLIAHFSTSTVTSSKVSLKIFGEVSNVPTSVLTTVNTGGVGDPLLPLSGNPILTTAKGLPRFVYIGAGYCPFCAAERWSMIVALSRFGTFSGLEQTTSSPSDSYANTNTLSFENATYTSKYLDTTLVEETNTLSTPIATPPADAAALLTKFDAAPYVPSSEAGGIPFIDIGNQYVAVSSGYSPQILTGLTWDDIAGGLNDPNNDVTKAIIGNANYLTAGICQITKQTPATVCQAAPIQAIVKSLSAGK